jgi:hypothetical protein
MSRKGNLFINPSYIFLEIFLKIFFSVTKATLTWTTEDFT